MVGMDKAALPKWLSLSDGKPPGCQRDSPGAWVRIPPLPPYGNK